LIRGHGNVVVGPNVKRATIRAVYTEVNARLQTIALRLGGPINYVSPEEGTLRDKNSGEEGRALDGWKDKAMRR
jgi:ribulose-5-phosphate 4-epimerase/fuculose-1-phosphate aldolase